jgi:Phage virion morphogenesis family.
MALQDTRYVRGPEKLARRMATIRATLALPVLTNEVAELLLKRTLVRFEAQVDPDNTPWRALAPATELRRKQSGYDPKHPILQRTQELKHAIHILRGLAPGAVFTNTGAGARIGVSDEGIIGRARAHQRGTAHVPMRRFLGIGRLDVKAVDSQLRRLGAQLNKKLLLP